MFLIITVWAGDIFAFSGGTLFGRHKLYPKISPKKSYEG
jgi:phosphatidate cytidylyltransferase